ncbi:MAG: hypothetical protein HDR03_02705 [Lachnospiraceae bacterium]|nr:hypothetical protein [Lachnospiraceae bacterium]
MKKKIVSMILSLSLVISGLPLTVANAAELGENELLQEEESNLDEADEAAETDEVAGTDEAAGTDNNTNDETETADVNQTVTFDEKVNAVALAADYSNFNVNSEGKVVGSDGVTYDDIAYLSANTVAAFDTEAQEEYIDFCDTAAEWLADGIENIVIAVDEDGLLNFSYQIPGIMLAEAQEELVEEALASETEESAEAEDTSEDSADVDSTEITNSENTDAEENETNESETIIDETTSDESSETESGTEEVTENESEEVTVDDSTEEIPNDDLENGDLVTDDQTGDDLTVEEAETDDSAAEEPSEDAPAELKAENMELIPVIENEQVELADELNLDVIDLGYGMNYTINATLPTESYFSKQLNANALKVYNAAKKSLTTGNTKFNLPSNVFNAKGSGKTAMNNAIMSAISAVELTYPEKVDWMATGGTTNVESKYDLLSGKVLSGTVTIEKSNYYSVALDEQANAKVNTLVAAAQKYAIDNYSTLPAYGVVEYFDKWICENNYYNTPGGVNNTQGVDVYYYCHSAYGALLKGYAVCESYAKAMSRLLDAVGIPNMYVTGVATDGATSGGHAWNYVQMPDLNWYLLDSTWNNPSESASDASKSSTKNYLLSAGDPYHLPDGKKYAGQANGFKFPDLSTTKYQAIKEAIKLNETNVDLAVKQKIKLSCDNKEINNTYSTWTSSNTSVAKVDKKGNVTAVAPGTAIIRLSTLATAGIELSAQCTVKVYQVKNILSARTGKATDNLSLALPTATDNNSKTLSFIVDVGTQSPYTAQQMVANALPISSAKKAAAFSNVKAKSSKEDIAGVTATLTGNTITAVITPKKAGSSVITLEFGGKKATVKVNVGDIITGDMFEVDWAKAGVDTTNYSIAYTGKAVAPKVTKKSTADKAVKFKTTYLNNKNAGTASVIISGTGKYGGEVQYDFTIKPLAIDSSHIEFKLNKASNVYSAVGNPAKTTVKYVNDTKKKTGLKVNTDYQIVYKTGSTTTTNPVNAGEYTLAVRGIGNYTGEYAVPDTKYTISQCEINKAKVTLALSNKPLTPKVKETVKLGKNDLTKAEYTITYYSDKDCTKEVSFLALKAKTKYYALITAKGSNMTNNASKKFIKAFTAK